ncbi:MAG: TetR/AcrR family transcriptional regulator [Solirubrobacteraceae bacterium]|nr:TetR/AcrR family transcriptional regulator [Solirubrobacteraceae bacterium]
MVDRIVDAAGRVLVEEGYERASTKRIAAVAGVSPGSVYQYFPNKEAIVIATVEQMVDDLANGFIATLPRLADTDPNRTTTAMLATLLDAMQARRELIRVLVEEVPRLGGSTKATNFEQRISDLATGYLDASAAGGARERTTTAVWMVVSCVSHLTAKYVLEQPPIARDQFVEELTRMVLSYMAMAVPDAQGGMTRGRGRAPAAGEVSR